MGQKLLKLFLVYLIALVVMAVDFSPAFSGSNNSQYQQQAIRQQQEMLRQQQAAAQRARQAQEAARRAREQQVRQQQQQLRQQQEAARRARQAQEAARRAQQQQQSRDQLAKQQQRQKQVRNQQIGQQKAQNQQARQKILKKQAERRLAKQADQRRKKQEAERKKAVTVQQLHAVRQLQQTRHVQTQRQVKSQDQKTNQAKIDKERLNALKKKAANDNTRVNKGNVVKGNGGGPPSKPSLSKTFNREAQKKGGAAAKPVPLSKETRDKLASLPKKDPKVSGQTQGEKKSPVAGKITGYTKHGLNQTIGRNGGKGVNAQSMLNAVNNPKKVVEQANGATKYVGKEATVILNKEGKVVTTYGKKSRGPQIWDQGTTRPSGSGSAQRRANEQGFNYRPGAIR